MSVDVLREVFRSSESRGVARNVLTVLADAAHPDGVTWLPISPPRGGDASKCITHRANASRRAVIDAIADLETSGELEVRKAQRGRSRINVYRVALGTLATVDVNYADLPFRLDRPFGLGADSAPSQVGGDVVQFPSGLGAESDIDGVHFSSEADRPLDGTAAAVEASPRLHEPSVEPSLQAAAEPEDPRTVVEDQGPEDPAAAEPEIRDAELVELVRSLPDADAGSPGQVRRAAGRLPRSTVLAAVETVRRRRAASPCGLLIHLLTIARAERTAQLSAALAVELGQHAKTYVRAPWATDVLKRDDPERYVRIVARGLTNELLAAALAGHDRLDSLLELARQVRAGDELADQIGTPEDERRRWVRRYARTLPPTEVAAVIDGWDGVDVVERQDLHELAETARAKTDDERSEAA